jgi:hypothetical protein
VIWYQNNDDESDTFLDNICDDQIYDDILNGDITEDEVSNAIKNLKNGKADGIDDFVNEYFKSSQIDIVRWYQNSFDKNVSLLLIIEVKSFPKQLISVMALNQQIPPSW